MNLIKLQTCIDDELLDLCIETNQEISVVVEEYRHRVAVFSMLESRLYENYSRVLVNALRYTEEKYRGVK
jgi:hypothetical protein